MRCPGQDRRYWSGDAVFDVPCPKCATAVEIFKDESSARCTKCGHRFRNPNIDPSCAKWCAYAEQCLGFVPERAPSANLGEGALASLLIQAVKEEFEGDQIRIARALVLFQHVKELTWKEGGDPRVALAAALLLEVGADDSADPAARIRQILEEVGLDRETIARVGRVIDACRAGEDLDTIELRIVADADRISKLGTANPEGDRGRWEEIIDTTLGTQAGKDRARRMFLGP